MPEAAEGRRANRIQELVRRLSDLRARRPVTSADVETSATHAREALLASAEAHDRAARMHGEAALLPGGDIAAHEAAAATQRAARDADYRAAGEPNPTG
jgi:hypothetical protein